MNKTIILHDDGYKERAKTVIDSVGFDPLHEVVIRPHKESLSSRQRKTYWMWIGEIANELGNDKNYQHEFYKEKYLCKIFTRDDEEYAAMFDAVRAVWKQGDKDTAMLLKTQIVKLTSITQASTKQMREFMEDVKNNASELRIALTHPDDLR